MTYLLLKNGERRYWTGNAYYSSETKTLHLMDDMGVFATFYKKEIRYLSIDGYNVIDNGEELGDMEK